jgi:hypothetical protein
MQALATLVLALHLAWILWVVFGALWTRGRVTLSVFHILSLAWGITVELSPWPCPLTLAEQFFEQRAGEAPYHGAFLMYYLDRLVYPDIPETILVAMGVSVCALNLAVYVWRYSKRRSVTG